MVVGIVLLSIFSTFAGLDYSRRPPSAVEIKIECELIGIDRLVLSRSLPSLIVAQRGYLLGFLFFVGLAGVSMPIDRCKTHFLQLPFLPFLYV